jgi:hypothetical protein
MATGDDPVFVLCAARSGSTLLRFVLDAHPDLTCPPETKLPTVCTQLTSLWALLDGEAVPAEPAIEADRVAGVPETAIAGARRALDDMIGGYLGRRGKKRFCDKSLGVAPHVPLLLRLYPGAKFLCLYRHPMDMISSGIEACPWGLSGFGFEPYAALSPGNSVQALAQFWADNAAAILEVQERYPDRCHGVRYEDLTADPEAVAEGIFQFIGVPSAPGISRYCLTPGREPQGPADFKIWDTSRISTDSVGRGWTVPADQIYPRTRDAVSALCAKLGYLAVGPAWGMAPAPPDPRLNGARLRSADAPGQDGSASSGSAADAPAPTSSRSDGPAPDGPAPDGPAPDGPAPDGPAPHGPARTAQAPAPVRPPAASRRTAGFLLPLVQHRLGVKLAEGLARLGAADDTAGSGEPGRESAAGGRAEAAGDFGRRWGQFASETFHITVTAPGGGLTIRWLVDLPARTVRVVATVIPPATQGVRWEIVAAPDTWAKALSGDLSISTAVRRRDMRYYEASAGAPGGIRLRLGLLAELLGITAWPAPEARTEGEREPEAATA